MKNACFWKFQCVQFVALLYDAFVIKIEIGFSALCRSPFICTTSPVVILFYVSLFPYYYACYIFFCIFFVCYMFTAFSLYAMFCYAPLLIYTVVIILNVCPVGILIYASTSPAVILFCVSPVEILLYVALPL